MVVWNGFRQVLELSWPLLADAAAFSQVWGSCETTLNGRNSHPQLRRHLASANFAPTRLPWLPRCDDIIPIRSGASAKDHGPPLPPRPEGPSGRPLRLSGDTPPTDLRSPICPAPPHRRTAATRARRDAPIRRPPVAQPFGRPLLVGAEPPRPARPPGRRRGLPSEAVCRRAEMRSRRRSRSARGDERSGVGPPPAAARDGSRRYRRWHRRLKSG